MLVLSRRPNEKVVFPNLGGKAVRIGIDAPPEIRVLREELSNGTNQFEDLWPVLSRRLRHELRNRLNTAALGLQVLHRRVEMGETEEMELAIFKVFNELKEIDAQLQPTKRRDKEGKPIRRRRALIVEDNVNESELLATFLRMSDYEVDTVEDGLKAIAYLKRNEHPDAVLLDMRMPRLDGPKTITSIRCQPELQGLKLFAVSGLNRHELGVEVGPRGVDRWFSKPLNATELVREMNRELDEAESVA